MTIYLDQTGPMIRIKDGMLHVEDLNPEAHIRFRVSRWERLLIGLRFLRASLAA